MSSPPSLVRRSISLGPDAQNQTEVVAYSHVGLGLAAEVDYPVPDVQLDRTASGDGKRRTQGFTTQAAGVYPGWDRFGRVARHAWVDGDYTQHGTTGGLPDRPAVVDLTHGYDRPGNRLTRYDGRPGARMPNWEFEYEYDGLDRLAEARRGSWDGSTFTAAAGTQEWALDLLGNWATFRHDRNGDGDFNDSLEVEDRTHNAANEVASAAIQGLFGSPFSQRHDHAGNWTRSARSGAQRRDYVHDAWNRLVKATDDTQPATVRGEYEYNGLHWRTVKRLPGSSVTAERRLFYSASWQMLEERIDDDVDEGFEADRVAQQVWGVRYIDDAVLRRTDANADGDYVDEGDRVDYYITDAQVSVVAVVGPTGALRERVVYSPYGEGRHHWPADLDGDGDVDSTDMAWYQNSANLVGIGHANYNPDADLNRDGVVGTQDIILALNWNGKAALASGLISDPNGPDSPVGFCGYVFNAETSLYTVRFRHYDPVWGRWVERDPVPYIDGISRYQYSVSSPISLVDPLGLTPFIRLYQPADGSLVPPDDIPDHVRQLPDDDLIHRIREMRKIRDGAVTAAIRLEAERLLRAYLSEYGHRLVEQILNAQAGERCFAVKDELLLDLGALDKQFERLEEALKKAGESALWVIPVEGVAFSAGGKLFFLAIRGPGGRSVIAVVTGVGKNKPWKILQGGANEAHALFKFLAGGPGDEVASGVRVGTLADDCTCTVTVRTRVRSEGFEAAVEIRRGGSLLEGWKFQKTPE
ncbi:MAG TPA: RHS repeat-associated core domain-containing protein [Phycisphaerales bacterium]|nr:RHS repeat-associated core domain-containing protein [Phycisphaerales bacterium]